MRITEIEIKNFRGFHKVHPIKLHATGKNAIIYGENGSGKSSLFLALKHFLSSSELQYDLNKHRNLYADENDDVYVKLTLSNGNTYQWSEAQVDTDRPEILAGYKFSSFLEYRDILRTYTLTSENNQVNLFHLLVLGLFADIENPLTRTTFKQNWLDLHNQLPTDNRYTTQIDRLKSQLQLFNNGLNAILRQLQPELVSVFSQFEYNNVELRFQGANIFYDWNKKRIGGQEIILTVDFANTDLQGQHPHYLNEAKLSAIGIAIYFSALKLRPLPANNLAILALDDVLIGLDMSNRLPVIEIIESQFSQNYQIFLMTYDREWFEILCDHFVENGRSSWKAFEFYCADHDELEIPVFSERSTGREEYIRRAEEYFASNDYKAAAIYARSAYEAILKFFCAKYGVKVPYRGKPKNFKISEFWDAVKDYKRRSDGTNFVSPRTATAIEKAVNKVLNPLSHSRSVSIYRREVQYAIIAVKRLYDELL
jgi:energy-coupling factor transporter ATP-binding protein EcfA2